MRYLTRRKKELDTTPANPAGLAWLMYRTCKVCFFHSFHRFVCRLPLQVPTRTLRLTAQGFHAGLSPTAKYHRKTTGNHRKTTVFLPEMRDRNASPNSLSSITMARLNASQSTVKQSATRYDRCFGTTPARCAVSLGLRNLAVLALVRRVERSRNAVRSRLEITTPQPSRRMRPSDSPDPFVSLPRQYPRLVDRTKDA